MRAVSIAVFIEVCLVAGAGPARVAQARPHAVDGATVVRGAGRFRTDATQPWRSASAGTTMTGGDTVESSADDPLEMHLPDGVVVYMEPGSLGRWLPPARMPTETNGWTRGYHLVLSDGEIDVRMPQGPKGAHAFLVSTSSGTLTDWRGKLHVLVHHDTTAAAIYEGALVVGSNGQGFPVYDGAGILLRKALDPDKSRSIPPAPRWAPDHGSPSFAVMPGLALGNVGFSWATVQGAASYRVTIATDEAMEHVLQRASTSDTSYVLTERSPGATYFAQVRAVGAEGIVGEWSIARPLRVVHYILPAGAILARDGTVVLPQDASVTMSDTSGVEVAYEDVRSMADRIPSVPLYWARLVGALRVPPDAAMRIVHLRDAALGSQTVLTLAHRQIRADVTIEPRHPAPGTSVDVRVVVYDPSGRVDPASETVTIQAQRDASTIAVEWRQTGSMWTGRVPVGASGLGVLHVVAKDSHGVELGSGFLELGGS